MPYSQTNGSPENAPLRVFFPGSVSAMRKAEKQRSEILACLDDDSNCHLVARHALALAAIFGLPVTFAHVLETMRNADVPADPLEWHLHLDECRERLDQIIAEERGPGTAIGRLLLTGSPARQLNGWAQDHAGALLALATHSHESEGSTGLGSTVQKILERALASLLLIPGEADGAETVTYRRLILPLDGSPQAESVLPVAVSIARAHGAELILAHVVPKVETIDRNLPQAGAGELCSKLMDHNEARARSYLEKLRTRLWHDGIAARAVVEIDGDPRNRLRRLAMQHNADLLVVSSHGHSNLSDVACGSVTEYLATHAPCPVLIIRPNFQINAAEHTLEGPSLAPSGRSQLAQ